MFWFLKLADDLLFYDNCVTLTHCKRHGLLYESDRKLKGSFSVLTVVLTYIKERNDIRFSLSPLISIKRPGERAPIPYPFYRETVVLLW